MWGAADLDEFMALIRQITRDGRRDQVTVPFLFTHGQNDRQVPLDHVSVDNMTNGRHFIADWIAETFGEFTGPS